MGYGWSLSSPPNLEAGYGPGVHFMKVCILWWYVFMFCILWQCAGILYKRRSHIWGDHRYSQVWSQGMSAKNSPNPSFVELEDDENAVEKFMKGMANIANVLALDWLHQEVLLKEKLAKSEKVLKKRLMCMPGLVSASPNPGITVRFPSMCVAYVCACLSACMYYAHVYLFVCWFVCFSLRQWAGPTWGNVFLASRVELPGALEPHPWGSASDSIPMSEMTVNATLLECGTCGLMCCTMSSFTWDSLTYSSTVYREISCTNVFGYQRAIRKRKKHDLLLLTCGANVGGTTNRRKSFIRGHHICNSIWNQAVGEVLLFEREPHDKVDWYMYMYSVAIHRQKFFIILIFGYQHTIRKFLTPKIFSYM